jgi:intraflagellar transport protein 81
VIRNYRKEREHGKELADQSASQTQTLTMAEQRIQRLQRQLKEIRQAGIGATPEGILQRAEEDINVAKFIANEKLPKEIQTERKQLEIYSKVMDESYDQHDLEDRKSEV